MNGNADRKQRKKVVKTKNWQSHPKGLDQTRKEQFKPAGDLTLTSVAAYFSSSPLQAPDDKAHQLVESNKNHHKEFYRQSSFLSQQDSKSPRSFFQIVNPLGSNSVFNNGSSNNVHRSLDSTVNTLIQKRIMVNNSSNKFLATDIKSKQQALLRRLPPGRCADLIPSVRRTQQPNSGFILSVERVQSKLSVKSQIKKSKIEEDKYLPKSHLNSGRTLVGLAEESREDEEETDNREKTILEPIIQVTIAAEKKKTTKPGQTLLCRSFSFPTKNDSNNRHQHYYSRAKTLSTEEARLEQEEQNKSSRTFLLPRFLRDCLIEHRLSAYNNNNNNNKQAPSKSKSTGLISEKLHAYFSYCQSTNDKTIWLIWKIRAKLELYYNVQNESPSSLLEPPSERPADFAVVFYDAAFGNDYACQLDSEQVMKMKLPVVFIQVRGSGATVAGDEKLSQWLLEYIYHYVKTISRLAITEETFDDDFDELLTDIRLSPLISPTMHRLSSG